MPKFSPQLARAALAKAETGSETSRLKQQYTADQIIEIERRVSAVHEWMAAGGIKPKFS